MQRVTRIEDSVRIVAGAVHPEKREPNWKPKYNFIEIDVEPRGADTRFLIVRVYPRVALSDDEADLKKQLREADAALDAKAYARYPKLTATEVKTLVVDDKWLATLDAAIHGEMDRVSQQLTQRVKELAERYETPLPQMTSRVAQLEAKVNQHLERMGFSWV